MRWLFTHPLKVDHARIVAAIADAERRTSGRIQVLIARHRTRHPVAAARRHFDRLGLARSPQRNSVLIFVAPRSRNFAVIGDQGVHEKCGEEFWRELVAAMEGWFRKGDFTAGLVHGVERAGRLLAEHFPPAEGGGPASDADVSEVD
jgi:uncharacterized membrane protein